MKNTEKGLSLVELLLTLTLLAIMVVIITGTISLSKLMFIRTSTESQLHGNLKRTMETMTRDMEEARKGIQTSGCNLAAPTNVCVSAGTGIAFLVPESTNGAGTTSFKTVRYDYDSANKILSRQEISSGGSASASIVIGRQINSVSFQNNSTNDEIQITFTSDNNITHRTQVFLRND